jgi:hypothetical protein
LSPAFSEKALKAYEPGLVGWAARMKDSLERYAETGQSVDMVKIFNCMAPHDSFFPSLSTPLELMLLQVRPSTSWPT